VVRNWIYQKQVAHRKLKFKMMDSLSLVSLKSITRLITLSKYLLMLLIKCLIQQIYSIHAF